MYVVSAAVTTSSTAATATLEVVVSDDGTGNDIELYTASIVCKMDISVRREIIKSSHD